MCQNRDALELTEIEDIDASGMLHYRLFSLTRKGKLVMYMTGALFSMLV